MASATTGLKILLVAMNYAPERSGTAPYTTAWAEHMARRHRVTVLAGPPHYPEWRIHDGFGGWREDSSEGGVRIRRVRHYVPARTSAIRRVLHEATFTARALTQRLGRPDLVLAVSPPLFGAAAAASLARRYSVPLGIIVQDIYTAGVRELGSGSLLANRGGSAIAALERRVLGHADAVLTIHDRFAATLSTLLADRVGTVDVVGNWVHLPDVTTNGSAQRAAFGWGREYVVLHAGNMGAKQGLDNIVEAARLADAQDLPLRYVLMGDGNQRSALERLGAGVQRLQFLPSADSATYAGILRAADLLLINERPGVTEMSLPSKLTSYCAAGRPILAVSGEGGATAAAVRSSGAGVVVVPGSPAAVNEAAMALSAAPSRAAEFGVLGMAYATEHQAAASAMAGYDRWLGALAERRRPC